MQTGTVSLVLTMPLEYLANKLGKKLQNFYIIRPLLAGMCVYSSTFKVNVDLKGIREMVLLPVEKKRSPAA